MSVARYTCAYIHTIYICAGRWKSSGHWYRVAAVAVVLLLRCAWWQWRCSRWCLTHYYAIYAIVIQLLPPLVVHLTSVITLDAQIKRSAIALHEIQRMQIVLYARLSHKAGAAGKRRFTLTCNIGPLNSTADNSPAMTIDRGTSDDRYWNVKWPLIRGKLCRQLCTHIAFVWECRYCQMEFPRFCLTTNPKMLYRFLMHKMN